MKVDPRSITDGWRYAHGYYSKYSGGAMCKEGKLCQDGNATVVNDFQDEKLVILALTVGHKREIYQK